MTSIILAINELQQTIFELIIVNIVDNFALLTKPLVLISEQLPDSVQQIDTNSSLTSETPNN
jgi:hypothetical protein